MIFIIGGVSGVGKTTIGEDLAAKLQVDFLDADDFHPQSNIDKMSNGIGLTDDDRKPWLVILNTKLKQYQASSQSVVLACSALKQSYRELLSDELSNKIKWIFLSGEFELIHQRMQQRNHFMPASLLQAQFDDLELPPEDMLYDVMYTPEQIVDQILDRTMDKKADIGLIGLGVMGKSLSRNIASKGFKINVFNRHVDGQEVDIAKNFVEAYPELSDSQPFDQLEEFIASLSVPRKVFLMVNAGQAVDSVIESIISYLQEGDIIVDGGNSHYKDTQRRFDQLGAQGIHFVGSGVSGGEEGALKGPSIMPGGSLNGYSSLEEILTSISAKDSKDNKCCTYIGNGGAGHFVKMVHNGIEYAEMQLIAEVYGILRFGMQYTQDQISTLFDDWSTTESGSYLLEITAEILKKKEENGSYLLESILDKAGNKGTGSWTTIAACELGVAIPTITAALFARYQSSYYDSRQKASQIYAHEASSIEIQLDTLRLAYQQARIINHHQGFALISQASLTYNWDINLSELARIWTNGCIIRSRLMEEISLAISSQPELLSNPKLNTVLVQHPIALGDLISKTSQIGISAPCISSALAYFNGYKEAQSLANVIQAQRDYFGAHTYERKDSPRGEKFHTEW